jgi:hypothetical protein
MRQEAQNRNWNAKMADKTRRSGSVRAFQYSTVTHTEINVKNLDYADNAYIGSKSEPNDSPRRPEIDRQINEDGFTLNDWDGR